MKARYSTLHNCICAGLCRKRECEADGSVSDDKGGFERPFKKQRLVGEGEVKVQAWAGIPAMDANTELPAGACLIDTMQMLLGMGCSLSPELSGWPENELMLLVVNP